MVHCESKLSPCWLILWVNFFSEITNLWMTSVSVHTDDDGYIPIVVTTISTDSPDCDLPNKTYQRVYTYMWSIICLPFQSIWDQPLLLWWASFCSVFFSGFFLLFWGLLFVFAFVFFFVSWFSALSLNVPLLSFVSLLHRICVLYILKHN